MIQTLKTILILNLNNDISKRICKNYKNQFNIVGVAPTSAKKEKIDGTSHMIYGDVYNNTNVVLSEVIDYVVNKKQCSIDFVINNTFIMPDKTQSIDNIFVLIFFFTRRLHPLPLE